MNLAKSKSKYLKCAIFIISICILLGALSACLPFNISLPDTLKGEEMDNTAVTITPNASDGLGEFNNGYSYVYTDKDLINDYRAGDSSTPYDISIVKVDTSQARGTQKNPYVIASETDWETFVQFVGNDGNKSSGKYFVLANDLDFDGKVFHPIAIFNGTFYGMGHSLNNITCSTWQYWNGTSFINITNSNPISNDGFGLFCKTTGATITDLIIKDYSYQSVPSSGTNRTSHGPYFGGVTGIVFGDVSILNCHTQGEISHNGSYHNFNAGIVGVHGDDVNSNLLIYRCSAEVDSSINSTLDVYVGGMLGRTWTGKTVILDCVANVRANTTNMINASFCSAISSICAASSTAKLENFVGTVDAVAKAYSYSAAIAAVQAVKANQIFSNCYGEGSYSSLSSATKLSLYAIVSNSSVSNTNCNSVTTANGNVG
ncbi:MAG: hypothetical protein K2J75_03700, partial [Clostridia bacterium]|nr:hypothetical protein [Clostridia bacterium]